jgi:PPOX class probable F420-dependent enzyme
MRTMTPEETRAFLLEGVRNAQVATTRADGRPHVAPVWFALDGDDVLFTTSPHSVKGANLRRDKRVALVVDDPELPLSYVLVEGTATLTDDSAQVRHWAIALAARYRGAELAEEVGIRNSPPGEYLVRVTPTKIVAHAEIAL